MSDSRAAAPEESMFKYPGCARALRAVGQMLERLGIVSFTVTADQAGFIVQGKTSDRVRVTSRDRAFLGELRVHCDAAITGDAWMSAEGVFQWHVTDGDIERYERAGREQRRSGGQTPDSHSISHVLRVIGGLLDQKGGRLASLVKDEQVVTLEYGLPGGRMADESYDMPSLYDLGVRMYMKRTGRNADARLSV